MATTYVRRTGVRRPAGEHIVTSAPSVASSRGARLVTGSPDRICLRPAAEQLRMIQAREVSCSELLECHIRQIERHHPLINALVTTTFEQERVLAARLDAELASAGVARPLHGLPVVHKDVVQTAGVRTTYGSPLYAEFIPSLDAVVVERLRAGAVMVGKSNVPKFEAGSQTPMRRMSVAMTGSTDEMLRSHLLRGDGQEDLCFVLYRASTGVTRSSALLGEVVLPLEDDIDELVDALPDPPGRPARSRPAQRRAHHELDEALLAIPAADYVATLTGLRPTRAGKVNCPFHEDRTPSLQLYEDGSFYCFGCDRGGTIYDFAAQLWGTGTKRREFLELRARLADELAIGARA